MTSQSEKARRLLALHVAGTPLLLPNPWDAGSARLLASLGFAALATTSSGFAATLGRLDGGVTRDEAIAHCTTIVAATELPVSADLENGYAPTRRASPGRSGSRSKPGWPGARSRITPESTAPRSMASRTRWSAWRLRPRRAFGPVHLVLTARAENHLHGRDDLADTIARLRARRRPARMCCSRRASSTLRGHRAVIGAVDRPLNVLALPGMPSVSELAAVGVARISVGGGFAFAALGALVEAACELRDDGSYAFWERAGAGAAASTGGVRRLRVLRQTWGQGVDRFDHRPRTRVDTLARPAQGARIPAADP